jgi:hypothetical protein
MRFSTILRSAAVSTALTACLYAQKPVLTEDFESGKLNPAVWDQRVTGVSTAAVEAVDGAHGKYALHIHYPEMARNSYAFIVATHLPDSVRTHFFGRAYMKITPGLGTTHNPLIFAGEPGWPISKFQEIGTSRSDWMPSYQENKSAAGQGRGEVTYRSDVMPPMDKWFLLEWEFNDNPSTITMWIDGERLMDYMDKERKEPVDMVKFTWPKDSTNATGLVGGYQEWGFGTRVWGTGSQLAFDVYYDDIAIGTSRLGPVK